ncbi:MAG: hypothetical protein JW891_01775 [Candidatus Lokiarchaeota archaeon]|nr:hypothetical protein [Candidatus Lokiarchaeota archaeon]
MKGRKKKEQTIGREEPEFKIDIVTGFFFAIGFITSWINMLVIHSIVMGSNYSPAAIPSYFSVIFTTTIPGVLISLKNRFWGYGYMVGFSVAGLPFMIVVNTFIGGYTLATSFFLFVIMWLVFWKVWRSLSGIKTE